MRTKITIDSNLINVRQKVEAVNSLEKLHEEGLIEIVAAERLFEEMRNSDIATKKANQYKNIAEPFVIGHSRIGKAYIAKSDSKLPTFGIIASILFPNIENPSENQSNDIMHLLAHSHSDSEYFVTNNTKDFIHGKKTNLNRHEKLENDTREKLKKLSIKVVTPEEALEILIDITARISIF